MKFLLECTVAITDSICLSSCYIICIKGFNLVAGYADTCGTLWDSLDSQGCFCMVTPMNSDKQTKCFSYGLKTVEAFFFTVSSCIFKWFWSHNIKRWPLWPASVCSCSTLILLVEFRTMEAHGSTLHRQMSGEAAFLQRIEDLPFAVPEAPTKFSAQRLQHFDCRQAFRNLHRN